MNATNIAIVVVAIVLFNVVVVPYLRRGQKNAIKELRAKLEDKGHKVERGPDAGLYSGATAKYPTRPFPNCLIVLTDRELVIRKPDGELIEIPRNTIESVREEKTFKNQTRTREKHVVVSFAGGEAAFIVESDHVGWLRALS